MHLLTLLLFPLLSLTTLILSQPPPLPTSCPLGKICPWSWGQIYTLYESQPNLTTPRSYSSGLTFEASQSISKTHPPKLRNRIYTLMTLSFSGLGSNGCSLDFNIPCNSSVPFYHHGHPIVAAYSLTGYPSTAPTWGNIVPFIGKKIGTFGEEGFKRGVFEIIGGDVCGAVDGSLTFVFGVDEEEERGKGLMDSGVKWNMTLMNEDIVVGVYVNFTC